MCLGAPAHAAAKSSPAVALAVPASAQVGETVTYEAVVAGDAGVAPSGTVDFTDTSGSTGCASQLLAPGGGTSTTTAVATCTLTLTAGSHTIAADYSGDTNYDSAASEPRTLTATPAGSTTALRFSPSNPVTNQPVTLTATVATGAGAPSGRVAFSVSGCQDVPVNSGAATCSTTFSAAHSPASVSATFEPSDPNQTAGSTSGPVAIDVGAASTTTALQSSPAGPAAGQSVTYTATVTGTIGSVSPTGTVAFSDGASPIASCAAQPLSRSGTATCAVHYSAAGVHAIAAQYTGDGNFSASSTYPPIAVTVASKPPPSVSARTGRASHLSTTAATLNGRVVTGGQALEWQFQYGTSEPFTHATPLQSIAAGHGTVSVARQIKGLHPGTVYRYELVVIPASSSTSFGSALSLTTRPVGKLKLPVTTLTVTGRTTSAPLVCQSKAACQGRIAVTTKPASSRTAPLSCGSASYRVAPEHTGAASIKLRRACLALLTAKHKKLAVTLTVTPTSGQLPLRRTVKLVRG